MRFASKKQKNSNEKEIKPMRGNGKDTEFGVRHRFGILALSLTSSVPPDMSLAFLGLSFLT